VTTPRPLSDALRSSPLFFEPVPPPARVHAARFEERVEAVVELLRDVPRLDALDVPELADENHEGKPHYRSGDPREFARALEARVGRPAIVNKVVAYLPSVRELESWAGETAAHGVRYAVLVGGASRYIPYPGPSVVEANRVCRPIFQRAGGGIGNIAIPQRTGEPHRMLSKTRVGATFFTTQILFDSDQAIQMVRQYDLLCRQAAIPPATVLLSFAPLADEQDIEFIRWLGADIPEAAERAILEGDDAEAVRRSEERALEVWANVRNAAREHDLEVPLGVNIEQISARHLEPAGHLLREFAHRLPAAETTGTAVGAKGGTTHRGGHAPGAPRS
jgi:5,10-methylenetetrahydrofolate reductase